MNLKFNFRLEDLPAVGRFVKESYVRDRDRFIAFSDAYDGDHLSQLDALLKEAGECISPATLTEQMKQATANLYNALDAVTEHTFKLERYVEMAAGEIALKKKSLNLPALREQCRRRNAEGVSDGIRRIQQLIAPYTETLAAKGYSTEKQQELSDLATKIETANLAQNSFLNQRRQLTKDNAELFNRTWKAINDVLKTGKIIYKKDPVKKAEYMQTALLKRVRATKQSENSEL